MSSNTDLYINTPTDIERETGRKFLDVAKELIEQGLSPTEITHKLKLKSDKYVSMALNTERKEIMKSKFNEDQLLFPNSPLKHRKTIEKLFKSELNLNYKDWLYNKYIVERLNPFEITKFLGVSERTVRETLKYYGIHKSKSQARKDAIENGLIDYKKINSKARKTRSKSLSRSNGQDMFRGLIRHHIEMNLFKLENYSDIEIIIGSNEWGILHNKEVDIPIIVIIDNKHYKYSIEYNNQMWHDDRNKDDNAKENELITKGWKHFVFYEPKRTTGNPTIMEDKAKEIVIEIIEDISRHLSLTLC